MTHSHHMRPGRAASGSPRALASMIFTRVPSITIAFCLGVGVPALALAQAPPTPGSGRPIPYGNIPGLSPIKADAPASDPVGNPVNVDKTMLDEARAITEPGERASALERLARSAIFTQQLDEAQASLIEAMQAARQVQQPLVHDQRIAAIISTALTLAEELIREGTSEDPRTDPTSPVPVKPPSDQPAKLERAKLIWDRALEVTRELRSDTFRTESIYRIAESQSFSSQNLIVDPVSRRNGPKPDPMRLSPTMRKYTDSLLVESATHAMEIDRPLWRDRALISVVSNAAISAQFDRALEIARMIRQAESRVDALIRIAENQAIQDQAEGATSTYLEAARAVASIPQDDPREILNNVLIDSLISVGRFDDARACVSIFDSDQRKILALSAVAESQGRRGLARSARDWISKEPSAEIRSILTRKLAEGLAAAIEQNRSKQQMQDSFR